MNGRRWIFTLSKRFVEDEKTAFDDCGAEFVFWAPEEGAEGYEHLQGFCRFSKNVRLPQAKRLLGYDEIHLEPMRGTMEDNFTYCCKSCKTCYWIGDEVEQGKRTDLDTCKGIVKSGGNMRDVINASTSWQALRGSQILLTYGERMRTWKTEEIMYDKVPIIGGAYYIDNLRWWDGYDGQETVVITCGICRTCALKFCGDYPLRVECKGGSRQFLAKTVYWKSNDDKICENPRHH